MPFDFYHRLSRAQQAVYRRSDAVSELRVPTPAALSGVVADLQEALEDGSRAGVQSASLRLVDGLLRQLEAPTVRVRVLATRPAISGGELHGLYEAEEGETPVISVWMRTAAQERVVAFKTFLRTLLHELVHHLDYELLGLEDSYHTHGFLRRESSLVRQLLTATPLPAPRRPAAAPRPAADTAGAGQAQLSLPW